MSTIRVAKRQRFAVVDRRAIRDDRLSWSARGLLVWALDQPDDFELTREQIAKQAPEGETAVRRMLKELTDAGYLVRERKRNDDGTFCMVTTLYEVPPLVGNPPPADPPVDNPPPKEGRPTTEDAVANATGDEVAAGDDGQQLFRAVAEVWTGQQWPINVSDRSRAYIGSALPDLMALGATSAEVHRRAQVYRQTYEGKRPTPAALIKHWPALDAPPKNGAHISKPFSEHKAELERAALERRRLAERLAVD